MKKSIISVFQTLFATLILLAALEGVCRLAGLPPGATRYMEGIIIRNHLTPQKPADEFRIFAFGESSLHGSHYWPFSSPALWMEVYLHDFLPGKKIRVVNFARMGQGSYKTYESFRDAAAYKPDLAIFYYGHNAFLPGNRKQEVIAKDIKKNNIWRKILRESRFLSWAYRLAVMEAIRHKTDTPFDDSIEYKVIESPPAGMGPENIYPNNSPAYTENIDFLKENTEKILEIAKENHIRVLFCRPAGNLKDFPPYVSLHLKKITAEQEKAFDELYKKGIAAQESGRIADAAAAFEQAYAMDDTYADLNFRLGTIYFSQGELEKAKKLFIQAKDYDGIKVRATRDILNYFDELKRRGIAVLDAEKAVISEAPGGILGDPIIEDNVHLSIKGHSLLGLALANTIAEQGWIAPKSEWQFNRQENFEDISRKLGITPELQFSADLKMVHYFGSRYESRLRFAKRALEIHPSDSRALRHLAWSYWLKGDREKALEVYEKLSQSDLPSLEEVFKAHEEIKKSFLRKFPGVKI